MLIIQPNSFVAEVHDRMPVLLMPDSLVLLPFSSCSLSARERSFHRFGTHPTD